MTVEYKEDRGGYYALAGGDIWVQGDGSIRIKTRGRSGDPVELLDDEAIELALLLLRLAAASRKER